MANAKCMDDWDHTSSLLALIFNMNRDSKQQRALKPEELNPYRSAKKKKGIPINSKNIHLLKGLL